jgi:flagella basal body P-ring formation protein FlgA
MKVVMQSRWVLIASLFVTCSLVECTSSLAKTTVSVPETVRVNTPFITLGKIADIQGDDQELLDQLAAVKLGKAPAAGERKEISGRSIETKISRIGADSAAVTLHLPETVEVMADGIEISPGKIEGMVKRFILKKVPWDSRSVTISVTPVKGIILDQGTVTYEMSARKKEDFLGTTNISLAFLVDGRMAKKIQVKAKIAVMQDILVSNRALERHDVVAEEDVRLEQMNLAELKTDVMTDPGEVIGKRVKRTVDVNTPLRLNFLEVPPLVKRGDMVTIVAESDVLKITTKGFVTESGCKGEMVKVINVNSRKELFAKVRDARTVEVDFQ